MSDRVTVAVIASALRATAWEMSEALRRSAHSPIIREMLDYSCAVFTADGEIVAQDELIPAFLGAMSSTIEYVIEEASQLELSPGDAFLANDPYAGGTHTPDLQMFVPLLDDGELIGWCGNIAHHTDVGGTYPGTEGYANTSIFEEGVRIPPIRFIEDGTLNEPVLKVIEANIREPAATRGDIRAQVAAARVGQSRMAELVGRYRPEVVVAAMAEILDQAERRIGAALEALPDGVGKAEGWLDDDGNGSDPVRIVARVEVAGGRVIVDLTGTDPQIQSGLNMSETAAKAAVFYAIKAAFDPDAPQSGAPLRRIDIELPSGTLANPDFPAAVSLRHLPVQRLADTLLRAIGEIYPDQFIAGSFVGFSSLAASCRHPRLGHETIILDDLGGGMGAHAGGDGLDAVDVHLGNVAMLPAEICEFEYPVRIICTELVPDSGGAGEFRGGLGIHRTYEFLDAADGVFYTEQSRAPFAPQGAAGGQAGTPASLAIERADGTCVPITKRRMRVEAGDRLDVVTGGGGGYGDPLRRSHETVIRDVREGKVSARVASTVYGLAETASGEAATGGYGARTGSRR